MFKTISAKKILKYGFFGKKMMFVYGQSEENRLPLICFAIYPFSVLLFRYLTATRRALYKATLGTLGLIWFTAQRVALYLPAFGANRRCLRIFGNVATSR